MPAPNLLLRRALRLLPRPSASAITYLFRDEFTTDAGAPLTSPRTAEPGPGQWTIVDTNNVLSIAGGELVSSGAGPVPGDFRLHGNSLDRAIGRAAILSFTRKTGPQEVIHGFFSNTGGTIPSMLSAAYVRTTAIDIINITPSAIPVVLTAGVTYQVAVVLRSTGFFLFLKGGIYTDWFLLNISGPNTTSPLYPGFVYWSYVGTPPNPYQFFRVRDLPAPFTTDYGIATLNVASPTDAAEYTGDADGIIDLTVTAPGSLDGSATTRCGFYYRADSDLSPAWHCYVDGTGAFNLDSIASDGTRTNRITVAGVITGGGTRSLRVTYAGTKHTAYTLSGTTWTKRGSEVDLSLNDTVTTIEPSIPAGWTGTNLRSYPRTSSAYAELDRT